MPKVSIYDLRDHVENRKMLARELHIDPLSRTAEILEEYGGYLMDNMITNFESMSHEEIELLKSHKDYQEILDDIEQTAEPLSAGFKRKEKLIRRKYT